MSQHRSLPRKGARYPSDHTEVFRTFDRSEAVTHAEREKRRNRRVSMDRSVCRILSSGADRVVCEWIVVSKPPKRVEDYVCGFTRPQIG